METLNIMAKAWIIVRATGVKIGEALKRAWAEFKKGMVVKMETLNIAKELIAKGGKEWIKGEFHRIYISSEIFNELASTSFGDANNKFFLDCKTKALMRSYKDKKPTLEIQY